MYEHPNIRARTVEEVGLENRDDFCPLAIGLALRQAIDKLLVSDTLPLPDMIAMSSMLVATSTPPQK
jgi:hypothetical protein